MFGVGRATVSRLLRRYRTAGNVKPLPVGGNHPRRVDLAWLREHAEAHPDARLVDRVADWEQECGRRVALSTMSVAMRLIGWTHKKNAGRLRAGPRRCSSKALRVLGATAALDPLRLIFVDESGFRLGSPPRHGWAPRGEDAEGRGVHGKWETVTMIGALALDGFRGFMTINAGTSTDVFQAFVQHELLPNIRFGDLVVMDNLSAHKNANIRRQLQERGGDVLFTPPYSPEFNPIEEAWAKLKDIIRRIWRRALEKPSMRRSPMRWSKCEPPIFEAGSTTPDTARRSPNQGVRGATARAGR